MAGERTVNEGVRDAFDELAPDYDFDFTGSLIGRLQRQAVWRLLNRVFVPGDRLLDLGCGTGEDAAALARAGFRVHGVDISPRMIELAEERTQAEGLDDRVSFEALPVEEIDQLPVQGFDGAFSNFSAINCVKDLRPVASALAERIPRGRAVALCVMSKFCLWETALLPLTFNLHKAFRRSGAWSDDADGGRGGYRVYYPTVREIAETFAPAFRLERAPGVGVFVPPTYLEPFAQKAPAVTKSLAEVDRLVADKPGFRAVADHRLVVLRRN